MGMPLAPPASMDSASLDRISYLVIQSAIEVHKILGPGLLERTYRACLLHEMHARELVVEKEVCIPVRYKHLLLRDAYRIDFLVENAVVVELKAVATVLPVHRAQVLSYLRATDLTLGLLINFHVERLVLGVDRIVNKFGLPRSLQFKTRSIPTDTPQEK